MSKPNALIYRVSDLLTGYVPVVYDGTAAGVGLDINGNAPVDASDGINKFLGQTKSGLPVTLKIDIGIACYGSILIPSTATKAAYGSIITGDGKGNVTIEGDGGGIYMMPGSNSHCITNQAGRLGDGNYPLFNPNTAPPAQSCVNVRVANLYINGNRGTGVAVVTPTATITSGSNQIAVSAATSIAIGQLVTGTGLKSPSFVSAIAGTTVTLVDQTGAAANATASGSGVTVSFWGSNSTTGNPRGIITPSGGFNNVTWYSAVDLISGANYTIDNLYCYAIPTYGLHLGNGAKANVTDCVFDSSSVLDDNTDGVHFDGPFYDSAVKGCKFLQIYDDAVALNAPEGYGGNIYNIVVSDCTFENVLSFVRAYTKLGTSTQWYVHDIAVSNLAGSLLFRSSPTVYSSAIYLGLGSAASGQTANTINRFVVSNVAALSGGNAQTFLKIEENLGEVILSNCAFTPGGNAGSCPFVRVVSWGGTSGHTIQSLSLVNCRGYRTTVPSGDAAGVFLFQADAAVSIGTFDADFELRQDSGYAQAAYYFDPTNVTSVGRLNVRQLDPTPFAAFINGSVWTALTSLTGPGLLQSQFQIPDANVANGVLFVSATSPNAGKVCFKNTSGTTIPLG